MRKINYREFRRGETIFFAPGQTSIDDESFKLFNIGVGWKPIVENLFDDLFNAGWDGELAQVKEKFGHLRVYLNDYKDCLVDIVSAAEKASGKVCEKCGQPAVTTTSGAGYWIKTLCEQHAKERDEDLRANGMARKKEK